MSRSARFSALLSAIAVSSIAACGDEECDGVSCVDASLPPADSGVDSGPPDLAFPDADPIDTGPPDLGSPDAGFAFRETSCLACQTGCPICLTTQTERFCADGCETDLEGCLAGFSCVDVDQNANRELYTCIAPAGICALPGVGFGTPCYGGVSLCVFDRTACQGDVMSMGYCSDYCADDRNCPEAYRCAPGDDGQNVCLARFASDAERCGREGDQQNCSWDAECDQGSACVHAWPGNPGICAPRSSGSCAVGFAARGDLCVPDRCACRGEHVATGERDLFGEALEAVGHTRCSAIYEVRELVANPPDMVHDAYRLDFFNAIHTEPWRAPIWSRDTVGLLDGAAASQGSAAFRAARLIEEQAELVERPAIRHVLEAIDPISPLSDAVVRFMITTGGAPDRAAIAADALDVPLDLQLGVARVIEASRQAWLARAAAFQDAPRAIEQIYDYGPAFIVPRADGFGLSAANQSVRNLLNRDIRYGEMFGGAADVLDAIDQAELAQFAIAATTTVTTSSISFLFVQDTPAGRIAIAGGESGDYDERIPGLDGAWAVLIDLGGHDHYRIAAGGNVSMNNPISVLIDLGGNDRYGYVEVPDIYDTPPRLPSDRDGRFHPQPNQGTPVSVSQTPRQGGARAGVAILADLGAGTDRYQSLRMAQGAGLFGAGVLLDEGGDDTYLAESMAQGAGAFGIGLLFDVAGRDVYRAYQAAQGFAFARAVGVAYDVAGDDRYELDVGDPAIGGDPLYPSAQRPTTSNASLGQGFAFGRRADFSDRAFMSAGVGLLIDADGDDQYRGSVFAQGGGFWYGTGILADHRGADSYDGMWYAMGAAAHYSLGILLDGAGNDVYGGTLPRLNVTVAGGHDFSIGLLVDESGDDQYNGSRITLGSGNASGTGIFVDNAGNDSYSTLTGYSLGGAGLRDMELAMPGSARRKIDTLGVFIDAGGTDTYRQADMAPPDARDDATWTRGETMTDPVVRASERGTAIDGEGESTIHARF